VTTLPPLNLESQLNEGQGPSGHSKIFGKFEIFLFPPKTYGNDTSKNYILSSWIPQDEKSLRRYHLLGNGISIKDATKIIESLEIQ
jgi:hypothetical protein